MVLRYCGEWFVHVWVLLVTVVFEGYVLLLIYDSTVVSVVVVLVVVKMQ